MELRIRYHHYRLAVLRLGAEPMTFDEWHSEIQEAKASIKKTLKQG